MSCHSRILDHHRQGRHQDFAGRGIYRDARFITKGRRFFISGAEKGAIFFSGTQKGDNFGLQRPKG